MNKDARAVRTGSWKSFLPLRPLSIILPNWRSKKRTRYPNIGSSIQRIESIMVCRLLRDGKYGRADVYFEEERIKTGIFDVILGDLKENFKD
jgi:hypothetical protein